MTRPASIARAILDVLYNCQPYALPEPQLFTEINGRVRPPASNEEFTGALDDLRERRAIATVPDPLDETAAKYAIREVGLALLAH